MLAAVFIPVVWFCETPVMPVFMSLMAAIGAFEAARCVGIHRQIHITAVSAAYAAAFPVIIRFAGAECFLSVAPASAGLLLLFFMASSMFSKGRVRLADALELAAAVIYIAFGFSSAVLVCDSGETGRWIFYSVFITAWVTDTAAFICGKLFGRHKLIPDVSPKKTVEGAVGGVVFNVAVFALYGFILSRFGVAEFKPAVILPVAAVASVFSQIGDLVMSHLKREHGIKDFGRIFPGHGGVLDRFDSVLAVATVIAAAECFVSLFPSIENAI